MQQMAMLTTNAAATRHNPRNTPPMQIYAAPPVPPYQQQQWTYPVRSDGRNGGRSRGGYNRRNRGGGGRGSISMPSIPSVNAGIIPYIAVGVAPPPRNARFSNIVKTFSNQNVCYSCGFDVEDWHTSATCNNRKPGHQDGFTRSNFMEYERANHPFCRKVMHKTMYPGSF